MVARSMSDWTAEPSSAPKLFAGWPYVNRQAGAAVPHRAPTCFRSRMLQPPQEGTKRHRTNNRLLLWVTSQN
jgi:hypothetical protein